MLRHLQQLTTVPWFKPAAVVLAIFGVIMVARYLARQNKWLMFAFLATGGSLLFFHSLYHRYEPKWLTPTYDTLSMWFPTKDHTRDER